MTITKETGTKLTPPGPPAWPGLGWRGNALRMAFDQMSFLQSLYRDYGPIGSMARGTTKYVFVFGPEYNHQILSNSQLFHNPNVTEGTMPFKSPPGSAAERLSCGLPLQNEDNHKRLRRLMQPVFQRKRVETYGEAMVEVTNQALANWSVGQVKNVIAEMRQLSLSVAVKTLVGIDPAQADQTLRRLIGQWMDLSFDPLTILFPVDLPGTPFRRFLKVSEALEIELLKLVRQKRQQGTDSGDVLSMLITMKDEDGSRLSDLEIAAQLPALFVAGHETTASALSWVLFLLSQQPQLLDELREEFKRELNGAAPSVERLNALPRLDQVIKETMRLLPPLPFSQRVTTGPVQLGPYLLPARTNVVYSPAVTHRMAEIYPEPARFIPSRWEKLDPSLYEYLPFGAGPRMCIGSVFAMTEIKIILSLILQRFNLRPVPGKPVNHSRFFFLSPQKLLMQLEPIQPGFSPARVKGNVWKIVELVEN